MIEFKALKDLCSDIAYGYTDSASDTGNIKFLRITDIVNDEVNWDTVPFCTVSEKEREQYLLKYGDIVVARTGNTTGVNYTYTSKEEAVFASYLIRFRINKLIANPLYVGYVMKSSLWWKFVNAMVSGSAQKGINANQLGKFQVPLPKLDDQNKIVKQLSLLDKAIINNSSLVKNLNEYTKLLFYKWFIDFNFPNKDGLEYKKSGGAMYEHNGEMLPVGWKYKKVDEIVDTIIDHRGKTPKKLGGDWSDEGIIALSAKIVKDGKLVNLDKANKVSRELYEKWMPDKLAEGDILMTSEAPLGEFYFILIDKEYCLSQRLFAIRANTSEVLPSYLYLELSQPRGLKKIIARQSGSTVFGIRQEELRKVEVLVPSVSIQKEFNKLIFPILKKVRMCEKENANLTELRDLLIKKLIN